MNHPETQHWMAFLYDEVTPEHKRELDNHLANCSSCASQVEEWRSSMLSLDQWKSQITQRVSRRQDRRTMKWAAAAAVLLMLGFAVGQRASSSSAEITSLKKSIANLQAVVENERGPGYSNAVAAATIAANFETARLLNDFSRAQSEQHDSDQQTLAIAMRTFDARLEKLRTELETVAVNTATGFQQTHENLVTLASYSVPAVQKDK